MIDQFETAALPVSDSYNPIYLWSACRKCGQTTPVTEMSDETWKYSFGKFLELTYHNKRCVCAIPECGHELYRDHVHYFGCANMIASFTYSDVIVCETSIPLKLDFDREEHQAIKVQELQQLQALMDSTVVIVQNILLHEESVVEEMRRSNLANPEELDDALSMITGMSERCATEQKAFYKRIEEAQQTDDYFVVPKTKRKLFHTITGWQRTLHEWVHGWSNPLRKSHTGVKGNARGERSHRRTVSAEHLNHLVNSNSNRGSIAIDSKRAGSTSKLRDGEQNQPSSTLTVAFDLSDQQTTTVPTINIDTASKDNLENNMGIQIKEGNDALRDEHSEDRSSTTDLDVASDDEESRTVSPAEVAIRPGLTSFSDISSIGRSESRPNGDQFTSLTDIAQSSLSNPETSETGSVQNTTPTTSSSRTQKMREKIATKSRQILGKNDTETNGAADDMRDAETIISDVAPLENFQQTSGKTHKATTVEITEQQSIDLGDEWHYSVREQTNTVEDVGSNTGYDETRARLGDETRGSKSNNTKSKKDKDKKDKKSQSVVITGLSNLVELLPGDQRLSDYLDADLIETSTEHLTLTPGYQERIVAVYEDEPSSIIAYALSSNEYYRKTQESKNRALWTEDGGTPVGSFNATGDTLGVYSGNSEQPFDSHLSEESSSSASVAKSSDDHDDGEQGESSAAHKRYQEEHEEQERDHKRLEEPHEPELGHPELHGANPFESNQPLNIKEDCLPMLLSKERSHIRLKLTDNLVGKSKIDCTIYYGIQFAALREIYCGGQQDFVESLARCAKWDPAGGKSGATFLKTKNERFVIKQVHRVELLSFLEFADDYFEYMSKAFTSGLPTILVKILGVYRISYRSVHKEFKQDVLVMENLWYKHNITRIYDLKGSMRSRLVKNADDSMVLMDENLLNSIHSSPLIVRENTKKAINMCIWNDSLFLSRLDVMDYSLIVGIDYEKKKLVVGIIDYIRQYTWDKQLETWVKSAGIMGGGGKVPTVISPVLYKKRFRAAMDRYLILVPNKFTLLEDEEEEELGV
eukprot:TRINITY_DN1507_c1_g1_i6.p1 TRINITY_DN1507_c1_g1~~TRINITY_DN1507_c1_g1_i6.p1  ORF type:complete len:1040 (+),score=344.71 TRINITY_DN1507_c1_g1_i6:236-3355(+)